ncbi:MAG: protein kinase [Myxococcales bacterium]|nr:protein kinase [Myxococcales bacterium]
MASDPHWIERFELVRHVAKGGMADVWLAHYDGDSSVPVAIKVLSEQATQKDEFDKRFGDEVRAVAALDHPGVVMVLDHGRIDARSADPSQGIVEGTFWLAMEYASRGTLSHLRSALPWRMLKPVLMALLEGLAHAHAHGVIHRDLKPANVLCAGKMDARPGIKLTDFGIAWAGETNPESNRIVGTPAYMAPEQIRGDWRHFGPWTDLYSLGCLVWWLCTGRAPYSRPHRSVGEVLVAHLQQELPDFEPRVAVPPGFEAWLRRLLAKPREDRFRYAADASYALDILGDPPGAADGGRDVELDPALQATITSTDVSFGESWRLSIEEAALRAKEPRRGPMPVVGQAPIPPDWRRPVPKPPPAQLLGAGLSLYGLRTVQMAGRQAERDLLWSELRRVHEEGRARLVLLRGAAGTGKSRLADWLCRRGHELGSLSWCKATFSTDKAPGEALRQMAMDYVGTEGMSRDEVADRVREFRRLRGSEDELAAELMTELLCPATDADRKRGVQPVRLTRPREYYEGTADTFELVSQERPLVAWFDDVQWGPHGLGLCLEVLGAQATRAFPCLMVLTMREEALEEDSSEARRLDRLMEVEGATSVDVGPLDTTAHRQLVRTLLGFDDELAARVEERTQGNPLFAVQLVGSWVADGTLEAGPSGFRLKAGATVDLPDDLHEVWASLLARVLDVFADQAQTYLEVAACLGMEVDQEEWGRACDDPEGLFVGRLPSDDALRGALVDRLLDRRLVVGGRHRWSFVHGMLRESLLRTAQDAGRLQGHHESCALMLSTRAHLPTVAERLGRHLVEAGRAESAVEPLLRGVQHRLATIGAQPAQLLLATVRDAMGEAQLPQTDVRWGRLWTLEAEVQAELGQLEEAVQGADRARTAARVYGWGEVERTALLVQARLQLQHRSGRKEALVEASGLFEGLVESARRAGDDARLAAALGGLAKVAWQQREIRRAADLQDSALDVYVRLASASGPGGAWEVDRADTLLQRGRSAEALERTDEAIAMYRQALAHFEGLGSGLGAAECLDRLARLALRRAPPLGTAVPSDNTSTTQRVAFAPLAQAEELFGRALARYEALGGDLRAFNCRMRLARTVLRRSPEEVWPIVARVEPLLARLGHGSRMAASVSVRLLRAALDGSWSVYDEALAEAQSSFAALMGAKNPQGPLIVAWMSQLAGEACLARYQDDRGHATLRGASMIWRAMGQSQQAEEVEALVA